MPLRLPRMGQQQQLVRPDGGPIQQFQSWFNNAMEAIENAVNGLADAIADIIAAQAAADAAQTAADTAQSTADAAYAPGGTDVALADGGTGASLVDPNADRILFWDDSAGTVTFLTPGTGLAIVGTTLSATTAAFRGALVKKAANQTGANYSTPAVIAWDAEDYDTDSIHDNASNNSRLTVPSGVTKVRVSYNLLFSNVTASTLIQIRTLKNGADFTGTQTEGEVNSSSSPRFGGITSVVTATSGDYFEIELGCADTSIDLNATYCWFAMEIVE